MGDPRNIRIEDYDYPLPQDLIAQYPLETRDASRLLVYQKGDISQTAFTQICDVLPEKSILVFNDTRVIRARFVFHKPSGARIEIFCLEPLAPNPDLQQAFASKTESHWKCYVGNLKKWKNGKLTINVPGTETGFQVWAEKTGSEKDTVNIRFTWSNPKMSFPEVMEASGHIPLPPYITREDKESDATRYQTIFAHHPGSVAAPTAGLHFTDRIMADLNRKGIATEWITLHVGAGTFKPVGSEKIGGHEMHFENYSVNRDLIKKLLDHAGKPVIPVGTTSMRTLESLYWLGVRLVTHGQLLEFTTGQWEPYVNETDEIPANLALQALSDFMNRAGMDTLNASTGLLIAPGYKFRICSGLITNFHLPKSTLLLLVAALVGPDWQNAYQYAIENNFRFLSYGDSCLFIP